jgi:hypothetical protein
MLLLSVLHNQCYKISVSLSNRYIKLFRIDISSRYCKLGYLQWIILDCCVYMVSCACRHKKRPIFMSTVSQRRNVVSTYLSKNVKYKISQNCIRWESRRSNLTD